ncbi:class IIb bacteriocin, lactobin A/cerein 7B family [Flavobacterium humidisoli]|uniref:Class IIb bacteriocin, lactobin A/cerein 7B family n=1 Tax=Flavobacterium humidisoli TaxID=2937442 RepID=A0ABY4LYY8_9FLAO|nr:class IIb bacteriocin, lactobin A/cerein 7B family [Flavobacterium humidisoli]UPZ18002.1 class IIb bacteriocin, lactobin A/cerein 7B family [Flavobacterium humidisoli]
MNLQNLNLVELNAQEVKEIDGGFMLHWGWYAGAFGLGFATGTAIYMSA